MTYEIAEAGDWPYGSAVWLAKILAAMPLVLSGVPVVAGPDSDCNEGAVMMALPKSGVTPLGGWNRDWKEGALLDTPPIGADTFVVADAA